MEESATSRWWRRGQWRRWRLTEEAPFYVGYTGDPSVESYDPSAEPGLAESFANLAREARVKQVERGYQALDGDGEPRQAELQRAQRFGHAGDPEQMAVAGAEDIPEVRQAVLRFISRYGPPQWFEGTHRWPPQSAAVVLVLLQGLDLLRAIEASDEAKRGDGQKEEQLCEWLTDRLKGVRMAPRPGNPGARTFDNLLAAMWLQVYEAHFGPGQWTACVGCGRLFLQGRRDQRYHGAACRNAAGVRRARNGGGSR